MLSALLLLILSALQAVASLAAAAAMHSSIPFAIPPSLPHKFIDAHSTAVSVAASASLPQELIMRNHDSLLSMLRSGENQVRSPAVPDARSVILNLFLCRS